MYVVGLVNKLNISYRFENIIKYWYGILQKSKYRNFDINYDNGLKWYYWSDNCIIPMIFPWWIFKLTQFNISQIKKSLRNIYIKFISFRFKISYRFWNSNTCQREYVGIIYTKWMGARIGALPSGYRFLPSCFFSCRPINYCNTLCCFLIPDGYFQVVNVFISRNFCSEIHTCVSEISFHEGTFTIADHCDQFCTITPARWSGLKPCLFVIEFLHTVSSTSVVTAPSWWAASIYSWNVTKFIFIFKKPMEQVLGMVKPFSLSSKDG